MVEAKPEMGDQPSTRDRILESAQWLFASASYEQVGLRDIAADVGIDAAYVHRVFGSKEKLFIEVLRLSFLAERKMPVTDPGLLDRLVEDIFRTSRPCDRPIDPMNIVIHSLSSPAAQSVLGQFVLEEFIHPLAEQTQSDGAQRAGMTAALLLGIRILRDIIGLEALASDHRNNLEPIMIRMLQACLNSDPAADGLPS